VWQHAEHQSSPLRLRWAKLLKRVFNLDREHCPKPVIEKILTHLGLQAQAPPRAPARGQALQAA